MAAVGVMRTSISSNSAASLASIAWRRVNVVANLRTVSQSPFSYPAISCGSSSSALLWPQAVGKVDPVVDRPELRVHVERFGERHRGVDLFELAGLDEHIGGPSRDRRDLGVDDREPEVERPRHAQTAHVQRVDRLGVLREGRGQGASIAVVGPRGEVEKKCGVVDGRRERPEHAELCDRARPRVRDATERRLVADEAAEPRGGAGRPSSVTRRRERHHPGSDRTRRAPARAARRAGRIPRVAGHTPRAGRGVRPRAELGHRGLADGHGPCSPEASDVDRVRGGRWSALEPQRALAGRHPLAVVEVLHAERHAGEGPRILAASDSLVDPLGRGAREVDIDVHERVQLRVVAIDRGQRLVERLGGLHLASAHERSGLDDGSHAQASRCPVGSSRTVAPSSSVGKPPRSSAATISSAWTRSRVSTASSSIADLIETSLKSR